jgi:hypothetical protein
MCAKSTGRAQVFLSASDSAVSQEVADGKFSIQSACALSFVDFFTFLPLHMGVTHFVLWH